MRKTGEDYFSLCSCRYLHGALMLPHLNWPRHFFLLYARPNKVSAVKPALNFPQRVNIRSMSRAQVQTATHAQNRAKHEFMPASTIQKHSKKDRKSTRLNSSHVAISYAVFCLKKK